MADDPFDLARFVEAQDGILEAAMAELRAGAKRTHWMWFVFPQLAGLGRSAMAQYFALESREEARAYLTHPVLGPRLLACLDALDAAPEGLSAHDVMGSPDDWKLRSCLTLFAEISDDPEPFRKALKRWFDGRPDRRTLELLGDG